MRERGEVAARTDRSAARHTRMHAPVEELDQPLERAAADSGVTLCEHVRPQQHRGPNRPHGQRLANTGRVAPQEVQLKRAERGDRNHHFRQSAKACIDAVDRLAAGGHAIDDDARRIDARGRMVRETDERPAVRNTEELVERQRIAVEENHGGHAGLSSCERAARIAARLREC